MLLTPHLNTDISPCNAELQAHIANSLQILTEALTRYGLDNVAIAFNGGKDCTVLLHLLYIALQKLDHTKILTVCIETDAVFDELEEFIKVSQQTYRLSMIKFSGKIKAGLFELEKVAPNIKAVLMGTRLTDPYSSELKPFTACDPGWPPLMRVSPMLGWSYNHVWEFLRELNVPYCSLYDEGYTSLGSVNNTQRNPALLSVDGVYQPAYLLEDVTLERAGRT